MPSFNKQTTLDLNGPILSFITQPYSVSACTSGIATFIGIATATFPTQTPANPATNTGYISYRWHQVGYGELTDGDFNGTTVVGSATSTLTLSGISSATLFNNSEYFLRADYIPSAYSQPAGSDVTSVTARSTGNAINDPKDSEIVTLNVYSDIVVTKQPQITSITTPTKQTANIRIRDGLGFDTTFSTLDVNAYSNFVPGKEYTITTDKNVLIKAYAIGGGGASSINHRSITGGSGGAAQGNIILVAGNTYKVIVGGSGNGSKGGYGGGGQSTSGYAGGGGGYTGLFLNSVSQSNALIIAGGGGGGGNDPGIGGVGGGLSGGNASNYPGRGGAGATQSSGSAALNALSAPGGGGGGGYYAGFGGPNASSGCCEDGGGGGGSGFIHPNLVSGASFNPDGAQTLPAPATNGSFKIEVVSSGSDIATSSQNSIVSFSTEASLEDSSQGEVSYQWQLNGIDLIDGENTISVPKNNEDYSTDALLRLPLWDKNTDSLVLEDLTNVANTVTSTNVSWVSGGGKFYNGYASFNSNSFITLTPLSDFNFGIGDFTIETWVYFTQTGWNDIFSTGNYGQNQLSIRKNKSSQLSSSPGSEQLEVYYNGTIIASGGQFSLNTWHHVAVTRTTPSTTITKRDSTLRLFIDGIQVSSATFNSNISATDVKIGRTPGNTYNMIGRIQDFQIYALSKYTANFTPSTVAIVDKRLVLSLPLWDNGTGSLSLTDLSSTSKTITPGSTWGRSPSWRTGVGKFYGGAAYFGGSSYLNVAGSSDFNFGTGDFTIECWVNFQSGSNPYPTGPYEVLVCVGGGYYGDGGTWFAFVRSGAGATFYIANVSGYASIGTVSDLKLGTWRHLAVSKQGTNVRFYVDGQYIGQRVDSSSYGGNAAGYIGLEHATFHDQGYYFPFCYMQDIKIYKGLAKYTSNFTPEQTSIVSGLSQNIDVSTFASGSQTPTLSISLPNVSKNLLRAKITHPTACNSPVYTNTAQLNVVSSTSRAVIEVEAYDLNSITATLREFDLTNLDYTITSRVFDSDTICLYAKDRDITVEFEMYGARGEDSDYTSPTKELGGEGGYSKIRFTMKRGEEYIVKGIKSKTALYLYRKAQLIACVGQGGKGGRYGAGGRGGGVNVAGENGFGRLSGSGGQAIPIGQLSGNGIFGSSSATKNIYSEDSKASGLTGGRTISCTKGIYWRSEGKTACSDLGVTKFRLSDGREVTNSVAIIRGFKEGYGINQTAGSNSGSDGGIGGNGATGGSGGTSGGGGGGSGYTDGSVTVVNTTLGGHTEKETKLIMRLFETTGDFYRDSAGRILIFSAATAGKDPRTLTKTTGRVLPGTDSCIDDVRWQNFIELAKTQNYRLTATLDGKTTAISRATDFNIRKMINSNYIKLKTSLTDWQYVPYSYPFYCLAWDEDSIGPGYGLDYSILSWGGTTYYYGYYGQSSNSFFSPTTYSNTTANWWILPPGVPDFP